MDAQTQEQKFYATAQKEAGRLDQEYSGKTNVILKAYEAAVEELGYSDKELMDTSKSKKVARLMFSDKYLGNEKFNPLLQGEAYKGFGKKGEVEKQNAYESLFGMNLNSFASNGGIIDRYGGLRRGSMIDSVERQFNNKQTQQLMALAWQKVYDPDKSLGENMKNYAAVLGEDPILAHTGAKLDSGRFESVDDIAQALATSLLGRSTKEGFQYRNGVKFN